MKNLIIYFVCSLTIVALSAQEVLQAQDDDGIYSVSGQKKEKTKKKKSKSKSDAEAVYFLEEESSSTSNEESVNNGYKQNTTTETGDEYAENSAYDDYSVTDYYERTRTNSGVVPTVPGYGMRTSLGTRQMYGMSSISLGYSYQFYGFNSPYYRPYDSNYYYGFYMSGRNPYSYYNPWGFGYSVGFYNPYAYYDPWGYGYGAGYYDPFYSGFYNPYGVYNPYYMHCPPYQSGYYGDNNLYTGPRPAVSGGSITTGGGDISSVNRPGGVRLDNTQEADLNILGPSKIGIPEGDSKNGLNSVRNYNYDTVLDKSPVSPVGPPENPTDSDRFKVPKDNNSEGKIGKSPFRWSGGNSTPADRNEIPSRSSGSRSNFNSFPNSPSRSGSSPSYNSSPRSPSAPTPSGGSRSSGGSIRR